MKKLFLLFGAITMMSLTFIGCGDKEDRMSEEEINARVDSMYMVEADLLTQQMTLQCEERIASEVSMRADQLVLRATDTTKVANQDITTTDETVTTDVTPPATTTEDTELTDDEIIRNRVDERLATLRTELEMQCEEQLMAVSRTRADSILTARGSSAKLPPARKKTGTNTGKTTDPNTRPGTKDDPIKVDERPGTKDEEIKINKRPGAKNTDPQ